MPGSSSPAAGEEEAAGQRRSLPFADGCAGAAVLPLSTASNRALPEHSGAGTGRQCKGRKDGSHMEAAGVPPGSWRESLDRFTLRVRVKHLAGASLRWGF